MIGASRPSFLLYTDGRLVFLQDRQYWQAVLSQAEISALMEKITNTGLFQRSEKEYNEGNNVLIVNGKRYYAASNLSDSDPLGQALHIIFQYRPKNLERYMPERLTLVISPVGNLDAIVNFLPQPTPIVKNLEDSPLAEYGDVWKVISGEEVPEVIAQFDSFPGIRLFKKNDVFYFAMICADYPYP
jgi:hypothetical protein